MNNSKEASQLLSKSVGPAPTAQDSFEYRPPIKLSDSHLENNNTKNPLQNSSSNGLKQSDGSSMQSVFNRIQNLREQIFAYQDNDDDHHLVEGPSQPVISSARASP